MESAHSAEGPGEQPSGDAGVGMSARALGGGDGDHSLIPARSTASGETGAVANNLLAALGLTRGEAAEVLHQHLMTRRRRLLRPTGPASSAELVQVLRTYAARKAAFGELLRQGKLPPLSSDLA